jgi:hypothetical protein
MTKAKYTKLNIRSSLSEFLYSTCAGVNVVRNKGGHEMYMHKNGGFAGEISGLNYSIKKNILFRLRIYFCHFRFRKISASSMFVTYSKPASNSCMSSKVLVTLTDYSTFLGELKIPLSKSMYRLECFGWLCDLGFS